jgi:hypothetical protein
LSPVCHHFVTTLASLSPNGVAMEKLMEKAVTTRHQIGVIFVSNTGTNSKGVVTTKLNVLFKYAWKNGDLMEKNLVTAGDKLSPVVTI